MWQSFWTLLIPCIVFLSHDDVPESVIDVSKDVVSPIQPGECRFIEYKRKNYTVCRFSTAQHDMRLFLKNDDNTPLGTFTATEELLVSKNLQPLFMMNAGMYDNNLFPVGYYVEKNQRFKKANTKDGYGNFHLKPNGIFHLDVTKDGTVRAGVSETTTFLARNIRPEFATQSGPMLVIDGALHPKFLKDSTSHKKRNGVGVSHNGSNVWFVISEGRVTFYEFATLYRDYLKTPNALFLDGTISKIYAKSPIVKKDRHDKGTPIGPIIAVVAPKAEVENIE